MTIDLMKQTAEVAEELGLENPDFREMLETVREQKIIVQQRFIESLVFLYQFNGLSDSLYGDYNKWMGRDRGFDLPFKDKRQTMVIHAVEGKILED